MPLPELLLGAHIAVISQFQEFVAVGNQSLSLCLSLSSSTTWNFLSPKRQKPNLILSHSSGSWGSQHLQYEEEGMMMMMSDKSKNSDPPSSSSSSSSSSSTASAELKLYQAFIFSVPIIFTFVLLFLFYLFYLRRRRVDWSSLRMRTTTSLPNNNNLISASELGLKKELREMLPIIVYKESFSIRDTLCSVCLGDYQAEDRLQQIPACGHAFHMDCIDHWLANQATCPLCRLSILASAKAPAQEPEIRAGTSHRSSNAGSADEIFLQNGLQTSEETQADGPCSDLSNIDETNLHASANGAESSSQCIDEGRKSGDLKNKIENSECKGGVSSN